ncbi:hypothetical protein FRC12_008064, partial [Ceratobasidium sp. 428]
MELGPEAIEPAALRPRAGCQLRLLGENFAGFRRAYALPTPAPAPRSGNAGFLQYPAKFLHLQ